MAALQAQEVTKDRIWLLASDGREVEITRAQVIAHFLQETGTRVRRRNQTLLWIGQTIVDALGREQIRISELTADFDDQDDTKPFTMEWRADVLG